MSAFALSRPTFLPLLALVMALLLVLAAFPDRVAVAGSAAEDGPVGQAVLALSASPGDHDEGEAGFRSPNGHATLRIDAAADARGTVRVNGRVVGEAQAALASGGSHAIDVSGYLDGEANTVAARLVRGTAAVSIDHPVLRDADPAEAGMDAETLAGIDDLVAARAGSGSEDLYAGAVVLVARRGRVVHESAVGHAQTHDGSEPLDEPRPMETDTIFDLASITKVGATTAAVMTLVDQGRVDLDDTLGEHVAEFAESGKADITIRQLLTHRSGLWEWQPTYLHGQSQEEVLPFLAGLDLRYEAGEARRYSDIGFMLLGVVVERLTGQPLDDYVREAVHGPLGMADAGFTPDPDLRPRIAATSLGNAYEYRMIETGSPYPVDGDPDDFDGWRDYTLVGEVNDGNAWYGWEGVAGHAGLFSTARDLAIYGQTLVNGGGYADAEVASAAVVDDFLREPYDSGQALGFWTNRLSTVGGSGGFGHGGFTGTEFLFDPERELVVVLLTNRQHPDGPLRSIAPVWRDVLGQVLDAVNN